MVALDRGHHLNFEEDLKIVGIGIVFFLAVRFAFLTLFWRPVSRWLLVWQSAEEQAKEQEGKSAEQIETLKEAVKTKEIEVEKMCKYGWHLVAYILLWVWSLQLMQQAEWSFLNTGSISQCWDGYPHPGSEKPVLKSFVLAEIAWYGHTFIESAMVDRVRGDFWMMMIHHVLAVCLLVGAFWGNGHRAVITVCFEQDVGDIVLYISKMLVKCDGRFAALKSDVVHGVLLVWLAVTWWGTRCGILGLIVYQCYHFVAPSGLILPWDERFDGLSLFLFLQLTLFWVLQVIWGWNLWLVIYRKVRSGELHDHMGDGEKKKKGGKKE